MQPDPPIPVPRTRVVTERRRRPFVAGLACCAVGLAVTLIGAVTSVATQAVEVAGAERSAALSSPITFDAGDETYGIILLPDATGVAPDQLPVQDLRCSVVHPDGATEEVDTASGGSRLETSVGREVGSFDGRSGRTVVTCGWSDGHTAVGEFYSVAATSKTARLLAIGLLVGGLVVLGIGVVLVIIGVRGRSVRVPIPAP